jgi:Astacin (Peptidase family M12A)
MSPNRPHRITRPHAETLEPRTVPSAVMAGQYASFFWPSNQIPYVIDPSIKNPAAVVEAVNEYNDETTLQWIPRTNQNDYVDFSYTNVPSLNETMVGDLGGAHYVFLDTPTVPPTLHEMGHVLGLLHEQSRQDASNYITVNYQNLEAGAAYLWEPGDPKNMRDVGPYDYDSIMQYNGYIGSANGQPVATEINGTPLPQNTKLSAEDISTLDSLYPAAAGQAQVPRQVSAEAISSDQIQITWADTNSGQATYTVERAVAGQAFQAIATLPAGSTSYVDDQVAGTLYEYMIVATTAANMPAVSQIVYAGTASANPTNLVATTSAGTVNLSWSDHTNGTASYVVEEAVLSADVTINGGAFSPVGYLDPGSTTFTVPAANLSYNLLKFQVYAEVGFNTGRDPLWISGDSNIVTVGSLAPPPPPPPPHPVAPEILGVVAVGHSRKKVSSVTIAFNEAMVSGSVSNSALYSVLGAVTKRKKTVYSRKIKIGSVGYNGAADTVLIKLAAPFQGLILVSVSGLVEAVDGASSDSSFSAVVR